MGSFTPSGDSSATNLIVFVGLWIPAYAGMTGKGNQTRGRLAFPQIVGVAKP
jgi:hypothetical protein